MNNIGIYLCLLIILRIFAQIFIMKSQILFRSDAHTYTSGKKINYTSVSTLVSKFKRPYNTEYWSTYKAYEKLFGKDDFKQLKKKAGFRLEDPRLFEFMINHLHPSDLQVDVPKLVEDTRLEILQEWKEKKDVSIVKGNDYHSYKENQAKTAGFSVNPYTGKEFKTIESTVVTIKGKVEYREPKFDSLKDLPDGFHPEIILWNNYYKLAGQSDLAYFETIDGVRYVDIDDFKTNKKIDTSSFFGKMLSPLDHLDCCNYNHYRLQISTYAWMLEQEGFTVRNTGFTHLNKPYVFPYMKKEVELMLGITDFDKI
jgi:hypothetical protein